jgi:hypothetical protein
MSRDVLITPALGLVQFKDAGGLVDATIQLDNANVLNITGSVTLGDLAANVYIGDGVNSVDIIFEQNGAVRALAGKTLTLGQANSNISFAGNITSGANITGNITGGNITGGNITSNGNLTVTGNLVTNNLNVVLNDISNQFDNITSVFALRDQQNNVTNIVNSRDIQVVVGGQTLSPYVPQTNWPFVGPFFTPYDSYRGFRVKSDSVSSNVIIYNSPAIGDQATITIINNSTTVQTRRYPYSPETIAFGD